MIPWQKPRKPSPDGLGHVLELAVAQVLVQPVRALHRGAQGQERRGGEVEVHQAVIVVVEDRDARAVGRGEVLLLGHAREVDEVDARTPCDTSVKRNGLDSVCLVRTTGTRRPSCGRPRSVDTTLAWDLPVEDAWFGAALPVGPVRPASPLPASVEPGWPRSSRDPRSNRNPPRPESCRGSPAATGTATLCRSNRYTQVATMGKEPPGPEPDPA